VKSNSYHQFPLLVLKGLAHLVSQFVANMGPLGVVIVVVLHGSWSGCSSAKPNLLSNAGLPGEENTGGPDEHADQTSTAACRGTGNSNNELFDGSEGSSGRPQKLISTTECNRRVGPVACVLVFGRHA